MDTIMLIRHGYVSKRWTIEGENLMSNKVRRRVEAGVSRRRSTWPLIISVTHTTKLRFLAAGRLGGSIALKHEGY